MFPMLDLVIFEYQKAHITTIRAHKYRIIILDQRMKINSVQGIFYEMIMLYFHNLSHKVGVNTNTSLST